MAKTKENIKSSKGKGTTYIHRNSHKVVIWLFSRNSAGERDGTIYLRWWQSKTYNQEYSTWQSWPSDWKEKERSFSSVQLLRRVQCFATPWITARQTSLSITNSWSSLRLMSIESVMPSSHLILCHPRLLLPPILPSIRIFSNESTLHMKWPKY